MFNRYIETQWIRYSVYTAAILGILILLYLFFYRKNCERITASRIYDAKEAKQGVAIDSKYFYAINNNSIGKYSRKSGKRVLYKKVPFKHLNGGKIVNGDLVVVNNPAGKPEQNALIWLDPSNLQVVDVMQMSFIQGSLTWFDWAWDKWWVCDARYGKKVKDTTIYCFNEQWEPMGFWKIPKSLVGDLEPYSLSGGAWFGDHLYVSGHDKPEMYLLELPKDKLHAKLIQTVQVCFDGQGFVFERGKGKIYVWGIRRDDSVVVRCSVNLESY